MLDSGLHPSIWMERQMKKAEETIKFSFVSGVLQRNEFFPSHFLILLARQSEVGIIAKLLTLWFSSVAPPPPPTLLQSPPCSVKWLTPLGSLGCKHQRWNCLKAIKTRNVGQVVSTAAADPWSAHSKSATQGISWIQNKESDTATTIILRINGGLVKRGCGKSKEIR